MQAMDQEKGFRERVFPYLLCYVFWVISMVLGFLDLVAARELGLALLAVAGTDLKLALLMDKVGFFLFGVAGLVIIILSESYYRRGIAHRRLVERFGLMTGVELLFLFLCDGGVLLVPGLARGARPDFGVVGAELVFGFLGLFFFFRARRSRQRQEGVG